MKLDYPTGATELDKNEINGLIPHLQTQTELNEFEQENIIQGLKLALKNRKVRGELVSVTGICELHKLMFNQTWKWAGKIRKSEKNLGVEPYQIRPKLQQLCKNINHQEDSAENIAIYFHSKLTKIHPFPNGNGRLARAAADIYLELQGEEPFSWGRVNLSGENTARDEYLKCIKKADSGNLKPILKFARS